MTSSYYIILLILINVVIWIVLSLVPRLKHRERIFMILSFVSLWVFLTIREPYSDMIGYETYFHSINTDSFEAILNHRWEFLFKVLLFAIRLITNDVHVMMGIIAFITLIGPFLFMKRYSKYYLLAVVMFIAVGSFHTQFFILRQSLAISVFLMAFHLIGEKKFFKYCITIVIATLFHRTAIFLLLVYPLVNIPKSKYKNAFLGIVLVLMLIFSPQISSLLMSKFYVGYEVSSSYGGGIGMFILYILMYLTYKMSGRYVYLKEKEEITKSSFITIVLQGFTIINNRFCRLTDYTRDSFAIMIPNSVQQLSGKNRILFSALIIVACICFVIATGDALGYSVLF